MPKSSATPLIVAMAIMMNPLFTLGLLCALPIVVMGRKIPQFLFAGQSNMIGSFDRSLTYTRFNKTMQILLSTQSDADILTALVNHLEAADTSPTPNSVYQFEASELLRLRNEGYLTPSFEQPLSAVTCSFYKLFYNVDYRLPTSEAIVSAADARLSPYAKCGAIFGPELMFGHVLHRSSVNSGNPFRMIKVAAGGTTIKGHWSKDNGTLWPELLEGINDSLDSATEEWKGIVWFQGENDSFNLTHAQAYQRDLTKFIGDLREVLHGDSGFAQPSDIPVIIVGLGCWIARRGIFDKLLVGSVQSNQDPDKEAHEDPDKEAHEDPDKEALEDPDKEANQEANRKTHQDTDSQDVK
ncbi:carbohydrate esterase [Fragilaria crotonensis]|nr:carbohydrate esterase [Fragilaria crotonensis]